MFRLYCLSQQFCLKTYYHQGIATENFMQAVVKYNMSLFLMNNGLYELLQGKATKSYMRLVRTSQLG